MGKMRFHIVHSVKGGCGKTAFSLFKSMELAEKNANENRARVLLLDADFKGSGLKTLIYARDKAAYEAFYKIQEQNGDTLEKIEEFRLQNRLGSKKNANSFRFRREYRQETLNDYVWKENMAITAIVTEGAVIAPESDIKNIGFNGYLDFVFCSPESAERDFFRYIDGRLPDLSIGKFRLEVCRLLKDLRCYGADNGAAGEEKETGQYTDIVIDMPPGYDEYSSIMLELLRKFVRISNEKDEIHYYVVTTADRSHLDAAGEAVKSALEDSGKEDRYTQVYAVFSEVHEDEFKDEALK